MEKIGVYINTKDVKGHIDPEIFGNFSEHLGRCIYNGIYVGEGSSIPNTRGIRNDIVAAFKNIKLPVLRWPGGCFADEYHWRDGIGAKSARKKMINTNWGGVVEDNSFGTHEFFDLCEQIGCEPYLAGNLGSGTVSELSEWIEYITFDGVSPMALLRRENGREKPWRLKYLGIGNENWGCGGNMRAQYYADEYRRYQSFCKNFGENKLYKIACGPNADDYGWTEVIMQNLSPWTANGISLHYYTVPSGSWEHKGSARDFTDEEYYTTIRKTLYMDTLLTRHGQIMDRYDPDKNIGLIVDEWGCWYDVEEGTNPGFLYQQNTMRDAIVAACNLNIFAAHCDRVVMANIAQAVNVLQAVILTEGAGMVLTPTYHVFDLYKEHQGGDSVYCFAEKLTEGDIPAVSCAASVKDGVLTVTAANCSLNKDIEIAIDIAGTAPSGCTGRILNAPVRALNDFDAPDNVTIKPLDGISLSGNTVKVTLPACSAAELTIK